MDSALLSNYRITPLKEHRAEHLSAVMYLFSKDDKYLDNSRPEINLWNRNKVKLKTFKRVHEKYLKSPFSQGLKMCDRISESVQRATTKVKLKRDLKPYIDMLLGLILK